MGETSMIAAIATFLSHWWVDIVGGSFASWLPQYSA